MRISFWALLLQQAAASLCLLLSVLRSLGAPMRVTRRTALCALGAGAAVAGALASGSMGVRLTLIPVLAALPVLACPQLFPAALRALPGITVVAVVTAMGWSRLALRLSLPPQLALPVTCAAVLLLPRTLTLPAPPRHAVLAIRSGRHRVRADALVDTGNLLRDPITGLPVIVMSPRVLRRVMALPAPGTLLPGMRLLPVRTFSGVQTLVLVRPDAVTLDGRPVHALLALAPDTHPRFDALVPACLFPSQPNRRSSL